MSAAAHWQVVLVGERAELAARPCEAEWGRLRLAAPGDVDSGDADLVIVLDPGADAAGFASAPQVIWHPAAASVAGAATRVSSPWPVADDLFDVPRSPSDDGCLVIAPAMQDAEKVARRLTEAGLDVEVAPGATRELLAQARIVVSMTERAAPETFGVLAAGRLLVAPAWDRTHGLQPWIDHATFSNEEDIVATVGALAAYPTAWEQFEAVGRQTAEPHRSSNAVGRLVRRIQTGIA
jgi:hypothetical protein